MFSAVMVVALKNLVHNVIFLALTMLSIAGIFVFLNAEFLAMVQIFLYVGGVTVLFLFAVMLTYGIYDKNIKQFNNFRFAALTISSLMFALMLSFTLKTGFKLSETNLRASDVTDSIGVALLSKYVLAFEIVSLLLLVVLIGAIILAKEVSNNGNKS